MQRSIGGFEYFFSFKIEKGSKLTEIVDQVEFSCSFHQTIDLPGSDAGVFDLEPDDPTGEGTGLSDEMEEGCGEFEVGNPWELVSHDATSSQPEMSCKQNKTKSRYRALL